MSKTATELRKLDGFNGDARLYKLSDPIGYDFDWDTDKPEQETVYVIVSAAIVPYTGPETYIFAATEDGKIADWGELPGSYRGGLNHETALSGAGYALAGGD